MSKKPHSNFPDNRASGERRQITLSTFTGPIPPPEVLHRYNDIAPGLAERIVSMAERESTHRHDLEKFAISADRDDARRMFGERRFGQLLATVIGVSGIAGGVFTATQGHPAAGTTIVSVSLGTLAVAFLRVKQGQ